MANDTGVATPAAAPTAAAGPRRFAPPALSLRFLPVLRRNFLVWRKLMLPSVIGNIADPLIMLVAFGYGLGRLLPEVNGVSYIVFLSAGSICMSTMMAASFESLYSAFSRMHVQRTWESLLNAPLLLDDVLTAEWLWAASKACFSGIAIIVVVWALGLSRTPMLLLVLPVVALTGLTFGALGLCFNALARGYDFFSYYFTLVLTPMTFLSGVFFPTAQLPDWLQRVSDLLPLTAAVSLARPLVLGEWPPDAARHVAVLLLYAGAAFYLSLVLTRRRFAT
jgi:lipooligosaccharide transport system permease protein